MTLRSCVAAMLTALVLIGASSCARTTPESAPPIASESVSATPSATASASLSPTPSPEPSPTPTAGPLVVSTSQEAAIPADPVEFTVENGTVVAATLKGAAGEVPGAYTENRWTPNEPLQFNAEYTLTVTLDDGQTREATIRTVNPGPEASFKVLYLFDGVGVGMPAYVKFDHPVGEAYRAEIEKHAFVTTEPAQEGSWGWLSDTELLWRPKEYWQPGTKVKLHFSWNGVQATDSTWLRKTLDADFSVGDVSRVIKVDIANHTTTVVENGETVNSFPSTTGKSGFITRSGTKIILEKSDSMQMSSETINIPSGSGESYDLNVKWAMRVTWTGEFIHAAPWSVGSQGKENVSHGCVGLSTDNAGWLYSRTNIGDVVEFTGSDRMMEPSEGIGVWLYSWEEWQQLSAAS
ncbi:Ig-like domain-containing protein [Arachnia propionica]|uniref:Secreted lipoprotein n=1 Tax=Arachnia propionica TaxID=1750 RepID=A0A3P1WZ24_9ACTN|nr:Ig-like domain-containing protein [Arachnia propionica]RRD51178.1 secreted lipoprotein [Arachnia propionica]